MLGKKTLSTFVGMKAVNSKPVCVFIVVRLYRASREFKHTTPAGAESKHFLLYALMAGHGRL